MIFENATKNFHYSTQTSTILAISPNLAATMSAPTTMATARSTAPTVTTTIDNFNKYLSINLPTVEDVENMENKTYLMWSESVLQFAYASSSTTTSTIAIDNNSTEFNPTNTSYETTTQATPTTKNPSVSQPVLLLFFSSLILITVFGNTLVILAVITTRRLRTVTNCFVMSLAVADWLVGLFVMPPSVLLHFYGSWKAGRILCEIWISLDILLCTASILSLCAISLDRYLAVTQPLHYKKKRTKRLALLMILVVWIVALLITCPPILGWYEPGRHTSDQCRYNRNEGYVVFSAMGSFFVPMIVMLYVYSRICCVLTSRHNSIAKTEASEKNIGYEIECDNMTSEYESCVPSPRSKSLKRREYRRSRTYSLQKSFDRDESHHTLYELVDISKSTSQSSSIMRSSSVSTTCKYSNVWLGNHPFKSLQAASATTTSSAASASASASALHICNSQISITDSCALPPPLLSSGERARVHGNRNRMPIRISSAKRETKTTTTLTIIIGGFIACWLPFFVYYLLIPFLPKETVSDGLMEMLTWLGWLNSAINPSIYAFYNSDFRLAFWRLTFRACCKEQNSRFFLKALK